MPMDKRLIATTSSLGDQAAQQARSGKERHPVDCPCRTCRRLRRRDATRKARKGGTDA